MIWPIVLTLTGFLIVLAEVFLPSFGLFTLMAGASIVTADVLAYQESQAFMWALIVAQVVIIPLLVKFAFAVLPRLPFAKGMILARPAPDPQSGIETADHLVGEAGTTLTDLRPSGMALVAGERRTVVSEMGAIPQGTSIVVVSVEGYKIVVKPRA